MRTSTKRREAMAREALAGLMAAAFVDIRATNYVGAHLVEIENLSNRERGVLLANMFHNVPGQMSRAATRSSDYQTALDLLWSENAGRHGAHQWLLAAVDFCGFDASQPMFANWR
jgi:hypothetical protein